MCRLPDEEDNTEDIGHRAKVSCQTNGETMSSPASQTRKAERVQISRQHVLDAVTETRRALDDRLDEKGYGSFASRHEIQGILAEEMKEILDEIHSQEDADHGHLAEELKDLAVGAIFGLACIRSNTLDW